MLTKLIVMLGLLAEGRQDEIPDTTENSPLRLGPKHFIPDLPLDDGGNPLPLDVALEDQGYVAEAYEACRPLMLLAEHFLVDCVGISRVNKWKKK